MSWKILSIIILLVVIWKIKNNPNGSDSSEDE